MAFFASFNRPELQFLPSVDSVFSLYTKMLIGMALTFQLPTVVFFLTRMRMVTARWLAKNTKYAILLIFIVAAVLTPTADPFNQTLFAAPMIALYFLSILIAWVAAPRARQPRGSSLPRQLNLVQLDFAADTSGATLLHNRAWPQPLCSGPEHVRAQPSLAAARRGFGKNPNVFHVLRTVRRSTKRCVPLLP
jgi:hypothetical protein